MGPRIFIHYIITSLLNWKKRFLRDLNLSLREKFWDDFCKLRQCGQFHENNCICCFGKRWIFRHFLHLRLIHYIPKKRHFYWLLSARKMENIPIHITSIKGQQNCTKSSNLKREVDIFLQWKLFDNNKNNKPEPQLNKQGVVCNYLKCK